MSYCFITGLMLNDKHINYSQEILRTQFKSAGIVGLQSTLFFSSQTSMISSDKYLQIIHSQQNHWIVSLSITSYPVVFIYDSLYESVDEPTSNKIKELFGTHTVPLLRWLLVVTNKKVIWIVGYLLRITSLWKATTKVFTKFYENTFD